MWLDKTIQDGPLRGFGLGGGLRYVGDRFGDNDNTLLVPGNFLVDSTVHYDYRNWRFAVNAKNLFDKTYVATCSNQNFCYYGLRRTVIGSVT
jgi:iron complex outermembrane receptor protein